ncbi:MAG: cytochrome b/b6 domain-containing protein [Thermosynechococcaceae cyanobacterium]
MATSRRTKPAGPRQNILAKMFHWVNIVSLLLMMTSGLQIYNANPVFGGRGGWRIPDVFLLGGWLAGGRDWHFAAMWLYAFNLLGYGLYIVLTRRWQRRFANASDVQALHEAVSPKRRRYAWHRLWYTAIIPFLLLAIASGLAMYKPAQLFWLSGLFGNWQILRTVHFITVPVVMIFTVVHSVLALKVENFRLIKSMFV